MNIDLKKIEEEVAIQKQVLINEKTKRNENAVLAIMHLRQHLNVYLHKYDFINSSKINKKIVEDISETFKLILNQRRKMKPNYRNKSLSSDDKREYYDELKFEEFTYSEKKLIKSIIKDLEKEI